MTLRRSFLKSVAIAPLAGPLSYASDGAAQTDSRKLVRWGNALRVNNSAIINFAIPEDLGYYKDEGLRFEPLALGNYPAVLEGLRVGTLEFGTVATPLLLSLLSQGQRLSIRNYMEYTYPFKWSVVVRPDSSIKAIADLKGKRVGIPFFGSLDKEVGEAVFAIAGLKENDVAWLATGEGTAGGIGLQRGDVDALFSYDTHIAAIEAANIALREIPLPSGLPKIGGWWIGGRIEKFSDPEYRRTAVGFARSVLKANIFIRENPEAAAYLFVTRYPETAPQGLSLPDQVKAIRRLVDKRAPLYAPYDPTMKWGYTNPVDIEAEIRFLKLDGKVQVGELWTNELVDEIGKFDVERVKQQARDFKLPY